MRVCIELGVEMVYNVGMKDIFARKKANEQKLIEYGFERSGDCYTYSVDFSTCVFRLYVSVEGYKVSTKLIDKEWGEEYTLHLLEDAVGSFVGMVREEYERTLEDICKCCFDDEVFHSIQLHELLKYALDTYGDELEFLWEKLPDCAILRRKDTGKWYATFMAITRDKLKVVDNKERIEVVNLHLPEEQVRSIIDNTTFYPAYHMNKKSWISVLLDGSAPTDALFNLIDTSYQLAKKK